MKIINLAVVLSLAFFGCASGKYVSGLHTPVTYIDEHMNELNVPFICLHGKKDVITNPEGSKELYQKADAKDRAIKLYADTYHDLLHEPNKEVIRKTLLTGLISIKRKNNEF